MFDNVDSNPGARVQKKRKKADVNTPVAPFVYFMWLRYNAGNKGYFMSVNLLNDKELNNYLINLVWGERGMPIILDGHSQENMKDANYIEQNKDTIVRSILTQYKAQNQGLFNRK